MKTFYLVETVTRDKLIHQGIYYKPKKPGKPASVKTSAGKRALLWVHGLTDKFYGDRALIDALVYECENHEFGFASFNNRGHDMVVSGQKIDRRKPTGHSHVTIGSSNEVFRECVYDIEAGITFLAKQGFAEVVVIGHSTGANKICYYAATQTNSHLSGVILASPLSDRLDPSLNKEKLAKDLAHMEDFVRQGKSHDLLTGYDFFPLTPKRFLSLYTPNSLEDQFDYGDPRPRMTYFSRIKQPLLVVLSGKDEYADRSAKKIQVVFDSYQHSANYKSVIVSKALHSYSDKETEVAKIAVDWAISL